MQTRTGADVHRLETKKRLKLSKRHVVQILKMVELDSDWKDIHEQIKKAIFQMRKASEIVVLYHLEICIVKKYRDTRRPLTHEDVNEIIKTYQYLN